MKKKKVEYLLFPIKGTPYKHQRDAFEFASRLFGVTKETDTPDEEEVMPNDKP